jgi:hypothetical protein
MSEVLYIWRWKSAGIWRHYVTRSRVLTAVLLRTRGVVGCGGVSLVEWLSMSWRNMVPLSSAIKQSKNSWNARPLKMTVWQLLKCWEPLAQWHHVTWLGDLLLTVWRMSVTNSQPAQHHILRDFTVHWQCCETLKSFTVRLYEPCGVQKLPVSLLWSQVVIPKILLVLDLCIFLYVPAPPST